MPSTPILQTVLSTTAAAGVATTLTIPAPGVGLRQRILYVEITLYSTAARTGSATPITVTTTNLPGSLAFTFPTAGAIGTTVRQDYSFNPTSMDAVAANAAVTIACPAVTGGLWRVNAVWRNEEA